jgi:hypothetical protein
MSEWSPVDLSLFAACSAELRFDEMLFSDGFDVDQAMRSADFGTARLDAHVAALGHNSLSEALAHQPSLPDEHATLDQIRQICAKLVDLQAARLEGQLMSMTVQTSVYLSPSFSVSHPTSAPFCT